MSTRPPSTIDRGFTLVELTVVIVVLGVVSLVLGNALYLGFTSTSNTYTRLDQSNAALAVNRYLTGDIHEAEGTVLVNTADTSCGGVAPLKLRSRSSAGAAAVDTTVVWVLSGTSLVRRTCNSAGTVVESFVVANRISAFTPAACAAPCTAAAISVTFTSQGGMDVPTQQWALTATRRRP